MKRQGRSRKGAWIEIRRCGPQTDCPAVAPVRERGLKCFSTLARQHCSASLP